MTPDASYSMNTRTPSSAARPLAAVLAFSASAFACRARSSLSVLCVAPHCGISSGSSSNSTSSSSPRGACSTAGGCYLVCQGGCSTWPAAAEGLLLGLFVRRHGGEILPTQPPVGRLRGGEEGQRHRGAPAERRRDRHRDRRRW